MRIVPFPLGKPVFGQDLKGIENHRAGGVMCTHTALRRKVVKVKHIVLVLCIMMSVIYIGGCCGGSTTTVEREKVVVPVQSSEPTLGKQLEDLDEAHKKGIITQQEYDAAKAQLLNRGTTGK